MIQSLHIGRGCRRMKHPLRSTRPWSLASRRSRTYAQPMIMLCWDIRHHGHSTHLQGCNLASIKLVAWYPGVSRTYMSHVTCDITGGLQHQQPCRKKEHSAALAHSNVRVSLLDMLICYSPCAAARYIQVRTCRTVKYGSTCHRLKSVHNTSTVSLLLPRFLIAVCYTS